MEGESRKMSLKDKVKEVVLGYRASSDSYVKHLRKNRSRNWRRCSFI